MLTARVQLAHYGKAPLSGIPEWSLTGPVSCQGQLPPVKARPGGLTDLGTIFLPLGKVREPVQLTLKEAVGGTYKVYRRDFSGLIGSSAFEKNYEEATDGKVIPGYVNVVRFEAEEGMTFKGVKICRMAKSRWIKEIVDCPAPRRGSKYYWMAGECEELEHVVLAALNKNYNQWCNRAYFQKNICWLETELNPEDEESVEKVLVCCDILYDKGTIQRKFTGKTDDTHEPIYVYRITDTETIDMFENLEEKK